MADISQIIAPKSDQLNADDLSAGDRTIHIREVNVSTAGREQPISIYFDGDNGRPWKPCKTMARLLANLWNSPDTSTWVGRAVTIYRDPDVLWGGAKVGGIRVRAVSHIDGPRQVSITESKTKRKLATIQVVSAEVRQMKPKNEADDPAAKWAAQFISNVAKAPTADTLEGFITERQARLDQLKDKRADLFAGCENAIAAAREKFEPEGKPDEDTGEGFTDADSGAWEE